MTVWKTIQTVSPLGESGGNHSRRRLDGYDNGRRNTMTSGIFMSLTLRCNDDAAGNKSRVVR